MANYPGWQDADLKAKLKESIAAAKKSKWHNRKTAVDGIVFDSAKEARRYTTLKALQSAGMIQGLQLQVPVALHVNGVLVCTWICDFFYMQDGHAVWEDTKGKATAEYKLKKRSFEAIYGVKILET